MMSKRTFMLSLTGFLNNLVEYSTFEEDSDFMRKVRAGIIYSGAGHPRTDAGPEIMLRLPTPDEAALKIEYVYLTKHPSSTGKYITPMDNLVAIVTIPDGDPHNMEETMEEFDLVLKLRGTVDKPGDAVKVITWDTFIEERSVPSVKELVTTPQTEKNLEKMKPWFTEMLLKRIVDENYKDIGSKEAISSLWELVKPPILSRMNDSNHNPSEAVLRVLIVRAIGDDLHALSIIAIAERLMNFNVNERC